MLGIIFVVARNSVFCSVFSMSGVVLDMNVSLCWTPFVNAWWTFCGDFFACDASLFTLFAYSVSLEDWKAWQASDDPQTVPSIQCPPTSLTSSCLKWSIALSREESFVMRWHLVILYQNAGPWSFNFRKRFRSYSLLQATLASSAYHFWSHPSPFTRSIVGRSAMQNMVYRDSGWYGVPFFRCRPRVCVFFPQIDNTHGIWWQRSMISDKDWKNNCW